MEVEGALERGRKPNLLGEAFLEKEYTEGMPFWVIQKDRQT